MAADSVQKRMAIAGLSIGYGIYPDSTSGALARGAIAWNYVLVDAPGGGPASSGLDGAASSGASLGGAGLSGAVLAERP